MILTSLAFWSLPSEISALQNFRHALPQQGQWIQRHRIGHPIALVILPNERGSRKSKLPSPNHSSRRANPATPR